MESLDKDRNFLTQGNVFTDDQIDAYNKIIKLKILILFFPFHSVF